MKEGRGWCMGNCKIDGESCSVFVYLGMLASD